MKLSAQLLFLIGLFIIIFGIACNFALGPILKYFGVFEEIPILLSVSGCPFIFIGSYIASGGILSKKDTYERTIRDDLEYGAKFIDILRQELITDENYEFNHRDTFGNLEEYFRFDTPRLYVTEDAPVGSIQKMSPCFNMVDIRQLTRQDNTSLIIIGGEPTEHMDSLIKLLGAFRTFFKRHSWDYPKKLYICTSTTDIDKLVTLTRLEGLIKGFIYIPYNMSSLITLLEYTKYLNRLYPNDYTFLDENFVFLLPEIRELLSDEEIELLGTRWRVRNVRDKKEIEMWKGRSIRKLQNFID